MVFMYMCSGAMASHSVASRTDYRMYMYVLCVYINGIERILCACRSSKDLQIITRAL